MKNLMTSIEKKTKVFVLFNWIQTIPPAKTIYEVTVYML